MKADRDLESQINSPLIDCAQIEKIEEENHKLLSDNPIEELKDSKSIQRVQTNQPKIQNNPSPKPTTQNNPDPNLSSAKIDKHNDK